ncbi:hypothetical protein KR018_010532, partial [Drosophila ironensis]
DDDREEGEIVDDFEMIISSEDEEFKLLARIQQLEEKNKDAERMDMLSANLAHEYNYPSPVERGSRCRPKSPVFTLSDVSSPSDYDLDAQRRTRRHKVRRLDYNRRYSSDDYRRNPLARRYRPPFPPHTRRRPKFYNHYTKNYHQPRHFHHRYSPPSHHHDTILLDSLDSVTEDEMHEYDVNDENDDVIDLQRLKLSRDKLRVALAREERQEREEMYKNSLRDRLRYAGARRIPSPKSRRDRGALSPLQHLSDTEEIVEKSTNKERDSDEDPAELKLRLIALKSAILKKHLARKKRDAERAYSPTDMINRVHPTVSQDDIEDLMEISPADSPDRVLSPPQVTLEDSVDTKPVDMELAETDSDDQQKLGWNSWANDWNSFANSGGSWRSFMPNTLPPVSMPIQIDDDDEDQVVFDDDEVPPPPPPFHIPQMHLEDEDARDAMHLVDQHSNHSYITDMQSVSMENSQTRPRSYDKSHPSSDDEAGALRAMLLSHLQATRPPPPPPPPLPPECPSTPPAPSGSQYNEDSNGSTDSDDPEELRSLLLSSIGQKYKSPSSRFSPEILKTAVRRIQSGNTPSKEETNDPEEPKPQPEQENASDVRPNPLPAAVSAKIQDSPPSKIIKIVKPNKVINKKTIAKRKLPMDEASASSMSIKRPTTLMIKEPSAPLHVNGTDTSSTTRLITTIDPANIKVPKMIINLAEESAASDDDLELNSCLTYASYADNASPLSLAMGSASGSTTRSNTPLPDTMDPSAPVVPKIRRTVINEYFEKKIDDFLKQARSKAPVTSSPEVSVDKVPEKPKAVEKRPAVATASTSQPKITPVSVRHLPVASQKEYLRLIERMQVLEKKKNLTSQTSSAAPAKPPQKAVNTAAIKPSPATAKEVATSTKLETKTSSVKGSNSKPNPKPKQTQASKETRLKAFENSFVKIGGSMITNLDKSLQLVEEAKKSKAIRLQGSERLKELFAEMQSVKQTVMQEELKLSRIQPEIQASHEIIISLKQKRQKLYTAAMDLGRGLRGDDYRLNDDGKDVIIKKSTQLTKEVRLYNSIVNFKDLRKLTADKPITVIEAEATSSQDDPTQDTPIQDSPTQDVPQGDPPAPSPSDPKPTDPPELYFQDQAQTEPVVEVTLAGPFTVTVMRELQEPEDKAEASAKDIYLREYKTPMSRNFSSHLDVYATICPFDLMGRCEDADCSYHHLDRPDEQ